MATPKNRSDIVALLNDRLQAEDCPEHLRGLRPEVLISQVSRLDPLNPRARIAALKQLQALVGDELTQEIVYLIHDSDFERNMHEAGSRFRFGV